MSVTSFRPLTSSSPGSGSGFGSPGSPGADGAPGAPGAIGPPGPRGRRARFPLLVPGQPGEKGDTGGSGAPGAPGGPGADGAPGADGKIGPPGIRGRKARFPVLVPGPVGAKGDVGATGATGPTGPPGGVAPIMVPDEFSASGSGASFTASNIPITDSTIYVAYNQAILAKSHWSVGGGMMDVLTLDFTPEAGASIVWSYYTSFVGPGTVLQEDFAMSSADAAAGNAAGFFDFPLAHTPIANGIQIAALNGPLLKSTAWTFLAPTTFRVNAPPVAFAENDEASIVYRY